MVKLTDGKYVLYGQIVLFGAGFICALAYILFSPAPIVTASYRVISSDSYFPNTVRGGVTFQPRMFDVSLNLGTSGAEIEDAEMAIRIINTSGKLQFITDIGQMPSASPKCEMAPIGNADWAADVGGHLVMPGETSPSSPVKISNVSPIWRLFCGKFLTGIRPELVLAVTQRYVGPKMMEGFLLEGTYKYELGGRLLQRKFWNIVMFDEQGVPYKPTLDQTRAIFDKYRGVYVDFRGERLCISR
jgi:hypothetical protein